MKQTMVRAGIVAGAVALPLAVVVPGSAAAGEAEREKTGVCTSGHRWDLNLEREAGVIDIDFEIDDAQAGQRWRVRFRHDGQRVLKAWRTADRDGDVEASRLVPNHRGRDTVKVKAVSEEGGVCRATLRI